MKITERNTWRVIAVVLLCFLSAGSLRSQFSSQGTFAGTGSGSANAQTATLLNVGALADVLGVPVTYIAPATNTGPTTFNLSSLGAVTVSRVVPAGITGLAGGEIISGQLVTVVYDGTRFQLQNSALPAIPGTIIDYGGSSCPTGTFAANSQTVSATTYPALFSVLGTIWGTSGGNVVTPDLRNRTTYGQDLNVGGLSNRITVAAGNFDGTVVGAAGAVQNWTLLATQIPAHSHSYASNDYNGTTGNVAGVTASGYVTIGQIGHTTGNAGGGQAHPTLSPGAIVSKCVRA